MARGAKKEGSEEEGHIYVKWRTVLNRRVDCAAYMYFIADHYRRLLTMAQVIPKGNSIRCRKTLLPYGDGGFA